MVQFHRKVNKSSDFMESFLAQNETTRALFRVYSCNFSALHCFWRTKTTRTEGEGVAAVLAEGDGVAHIASQETPCRRPHDVRPLARRREPPQRRQPSLRRPHTTSAPSQRRHPPESTSSITDPHLQVICKLLMYLPHTFFFP